MKRFILILSFTIGLLITPPCITQAQLPIAEVIKQGIKQVIKALDLMIQRLQNKTIWLQNVQQVLENKLSQLKLAEIAHWSDQQRTLYKNYFDELRKVKNVIATYKRVRMIIDRQKQLIHEYQFMRDRIEQDSQFTRQEIEFMIRVYTGMIDDSLHNLDQLLLVINSFKTQMTDGKRLELINKAGDGINQNYQDLHQFNTQNIQLSLHRAKDAHEIESVKKLYGLK